MGSVCPLALWDEPWGSERVFSRSINSRCSVMSALLPAVSIIIPVYNRAASIGRALASVVAQSVDDWELIVVDDGSTDNTPDIVAALDESRLRLIRHPVNRGAAAARNTGIAAARGRYIAFLDSDDEWMPLKLQVQLHVLDAPDGPDAVTGGFIMHRKTDGATTVRHPSSDPRGWFYAFLDGCYVAPGSTLMVRRSCFETVGAMDETLPRFEDWDWFFRFIATYRFVCMNDVLAVIHVGNYPGFATVARSARLLAERQRQHILDVAGHRGWRRFCASLAIELVVAALRNRMPVRACGHFARAMVYDPVRALRLFKRLPGRLRSGTGTVGSGIA
jgi:glycosyltransferase involved in cell wall biosynthesis